MSKNIILVTSVIKTSTNPLSYTPIRSVFNETERYEQTLKTISTIREKIPDCEILLIECSEIQDYMEVELNKRVDHFLRVEENIETITGPHKGAGLATLLLGALNKFDISKYDNIFCISGRYWLNDSFDYVEFDNEQNNFQTRADGAIVATNFYKITDTELFKQALQYCTTSTNSFEFDFMNIFRGKFKNIETLGVDGFISVDATYVSY